MYFFVFSLSQQNENFFIAFGTTTTMLNLKKHGKTIKFKSSVLTVYLEQKLENQAAQLSTYERQQKEIEKQQAFVERFRASATRSTQAKSREKQLEKIEIIESPTVGLKTLTFHFPPSPRMVSEVALLKDLVDTYD